jgi:hypothetical protein
MTRDKRPKKFGFRPHERRLQSANPIPEISLKKMGFANRNRKWLAPGEEALRGL